MPRAMATTRSAAQTWTLAAFVVWSGVVLFGVMWIVSAVRSDPPVFAPSPTPAVAPATAAPPGVRVQFGGGFDNDERKKDKERDKELEKRLEKAEKERRKWESKGGKHKGDD